MEEETRDANDDDNEEYRAIRDLLTLLMWASNEIRNGDPDRAYSVINDVLEQYQCTKWW